MVDRLDMVIFIDSIAHMLHQEKCYPTLDDLAEISKDMGETSRPDRLLVLKGDGAAVARLEALQPIVAVGLGDIHKGNTLEQGRSYWKLMERAIRHGVEKLSNEEVVTLREWCYARI